MAVITRLTHPDALWPGVKLFFGLNYNRWPAEWSKIFKKVDSNKAQEKLVALSGFGLAAVKSEGESIVYDTDGQGPANIFTHVVYGLGYIVTREEMEDNQYTEVSEPRASNLSRSMNITTEIVHANILNRGFNGSYVYGDGQPLFSASHPSRAGTFSNLLTAADFSEAALEDALKATARMTDDRGLPIAARGVQLIMGSDYQFDVKRILNSAGMPGTANNDVNPVRDELSGGVVINHYLSDPDAWFLKTDVENGLISMWRRQPALEKGNDFDTENLKAKSTMRFSAGFGDPRALLGSQGA